MATKDKKEESLRSKMADAAKKYGKDSQQYLDARKGVNDYLRSQGRNTNSDTVAGKPSGYVNPNAGIRQETPDVQRTSGPLELPGSDITQDTGQPIAVAGSGNPLGSPSSGDLKKLFGEFGGAAGAAGNMYSDVMPLYQLNTELTQAQIDALAGARATADAARTRDPVQDEFVRMMMDRATNGLSSPELTGLREEGMSGIGNQLENVLRQLSLRNAGSGVSGPASTIGQRAAGIQALQAQRGLERDIMKQNTDFMNTNAQAGAVAANRANDSYFSNLATAGQNFWNNATAGATQINENTKYNFAQGENYALGKLGAIVGGADWSNQRDLANEANKLAEKAINKGMPHSGGAGGAAAGYSGSSLGESYKNTKPVGSTPNY